MTYWFIWKLQISGVFTITCINLNITNIQLSLCPLRIRYIIVQLYAFITLMSDILDCQDRRIIVLYYTMPDIMFISYQRLR